MGANKLQNGETKKNQNDGESHENHVDQFVEQKKKEFFVFFHTKEILRKQYENIARLKHCKRDIGLFIFISFFDCATSFCGDFQNVSPCIVFCRAFLKVSHFFFFVFRNCALLF